MRIWISWSHGVWKSTIINGLILGEKYTKIPELARINMEILNNLPQNMLEEEINLFETFVLLDQITHEISNDYFVIDRTVIDLLAYSKYLVNPLIYKKLYTIVEKYLSRKRYDFLFFIPIELDFLKMNFRKRLM